MNFDVSEEQQLLQETVGHAAWIVDACDDEQMAQAVLTLLSDRGVRIRHIEAGLRCSRRFRWDRAAEATLAVYEEVCHATPVQMATT